MNTLTDSKKIFLSPSGADIKNSLFSELTYNIQGLVKKDKSIIYNTIRIIHAEIPYSFYIVNQYNNKLNLSTGNIVIPNGNYNANTFMVAIKSLLPVGMDITFNTTNGKFTFTYNSEFQIYNTSTCYKLIGLNKANYSSTSGTLVCVNPANFLGSKNIYIKAKNIILENFNTTTKDYSTLSSIALSVPPFGIVMYDNSSASKNLIKNSQLDYLNIEICDEDNNLVDFNGIEWTITLEIETTIQVQQNTKSISEYLSELYNQNNN